ncbi:MAG: hypothetical protein M3500_13500 [Actinomycetota bacterium]|nr:hypothetical protein [Actinomycetota bacterium]
MDRFNVDRIDEDWPFEIDHQAGHLFKHPRLGVDDISDVWANDPLFYPAKPPADWLMVAEVAGQVLVVPLTPSKHRRSGPMPTRRLLRRRRPPRPSLPEGPITTMSMTPEQENTYYADPANQEPQGPPVRRRAKLSEPVPVRFPEALLSEVRSRAAADDRSVSNWIRRAVEHELERSTN